jgi:hypothetical protein
VKKDKRHTVSRLFHAKGDKDAIANWRQDLNRILQIFNVCLVIPSDDRYESTFQTELLINNHTMLSDLHRNALTGQGGVDDHPVSTAF